MIGNAVHHINLFCFIYFILYRSNAACKYTEDEDDDEEEEEEEEEEEQDPLSSQGSLWHHSDGDSLSRLRAMGAFAYAASQGTYVR